MSPEGNHHVKTSPEAEDDSVRVWQAGSWAGIGRLRWAVPPGKETCAAATHVGSPGTHSVSLGGEGKRGAAASLCANTLDISRVLLSSFPQLLSPPLARLWSSRHLCCSFSPCSLSCCRSVPPRMQSPELLQQMRYLQVHPQFSCMPTAPRLPCAL